MGRNTTRRIRRSPNGDAALIKRDSTGTAQMTNAGSGTDTNFTAASETAVANVNDDDVDHVAFTSATLAVSQGGTMTNTPVDLKVVRNGATITSATGITTTTTLTTSNILDPMEEADWEFRAAGNGSAVTVTWNASREEHWA